MARPAVKKQIIEETAIRLFATQGLARTTTKDIAREASVAEGALYRHWPSKDAMAWALFDAEVKSFSESLIPVLTDSSRSVADAIGAAIELIYGYFDDETMRCTFILLTQHDFPDVRVEAAFNPADLISEFLSARVERLRDDKQGSALLASMLMGAALQPLYMIRYERIGAKARTLVTDVQAHCVAMLGEAN